MRAISTIIIGLMLWGPPAAAIITNRLKPDIGTALGVPYAFATGVLGAAVLTIVLALAARRWQGMRPHYWVVGTMIVAALMLFALANRGTLSVVN